MLNLDGKKFIVFMFSGVLKTSEGNSSFEMCDLMAESFTKGIKFVSLSIETDSYTFRETKEFLDSNYAIEAMFVKDSTCVIDFLDKLAIHNDYKHEDIVFLSKSASLIKEAKENGYDAYLCSEGEVC